MDTFYTLLDIPAQASAEDIDAAYHRQRERYSVERVGELGDEFRSIADARTADLARAYAVLSDTSQRRAYDASIGLIPAVAAPRAPRRTGLNRRELLMAVGGGLAGLLVIAVV